VESLENRVFLSGSPFGGTAWSIPGLIEAENFDVGGEGVAYHDNESSALGNAPNYRPGEGVDVQNSSDVGGGYAIGYTKPGEWLEYTIDVEEAGIYELEIRMATASSGGVFHVEMDGVDKTGAMSLTGTGGWNTWKTLTRSNISLSAGEQVLRLKLDSGSGSNDWGNINWIKLRSQSHTKLTGTVIGTAGSWNNNGLTKDNVFDGNTSTYFDAPTASNSWAGLDLGSAKRISRIAYFPRSGNGNRMTGGKFQASNTADFSSGVVDLATVPSAPNIGWTELNVTDTGTYRYVRYLSPTNGYCNVAEIEFFTPTATSAPTAPSGTSAAGLSSQAARVTWTDNSSDETEFRIERKTGSGGTWATLATVETGVTTYDDSTLAPSTTYYYRVVAINPVGASSASNEDDITTQAAEYTTVDIGNATLGVTTALIEGQSYDISARSGDIGGSSDNLRFVYKQITGDFDIKVRVASFTNTNSWAKSGLMLRESLSANSRQVTAAATPSTNGTRHLIRSSTGGSSGADGYTNQPGAYDVNFPNTWLRLRRSGNDVTTYRSTDGVTWQQMKYHTLASLPSSVYVGMAVSSSNTGSTATVQFRDLSDITFSAAPTPPGYPTAVSGGASAINLSWHDVAGETGYTIERSLSGTSGWVTAGTAPAGALGFDDLGLAAGTTYYYRVHASNGSGDGPWSTVTSASTSTHSSFISENIGTAAWGSTSVESEGDEYTLTVRSGTIWDSSDSLRLAYQQRTGDFDVAMRLSSVSGPGTWSMAGLMARESTAANSAHVSVLATPGTNGTFMRYRASTGANTGQSGSGTVSYPNTWLRLKRVGNDFTAYGSTDWQSWTQLASRSQTMPSTILVGMALASTGNAEYDATAAAEFQDLTGSLDLPAAATGLSSSGHTDTTVNLSWTDNASNETGYRVEQSTDGTTWSTATTGSLGANATSATVTGLSPATTYLFRVIAINTDGDSAASNIVQRTTTPAAPANLSLTVISSFRIDLEWDDVSGDTGYTIQRSTASDFSANLETFNNSANDTTFTDDTLSAGTTYYYRVRATGTGGNSAWSTVESETTSGSTPVINSISYDGPIGEGQNVTVTVDATGQGTLTYEFDWNNDGSYETDAGENNFAGHIFDDNGIYRVNVRVSNASGSVMDYIEIGVANVAPELSISGNRTFNLDDSGHIAVVFSDEGILDTHVASIDWGDGQTSAPTFVEEEGAAAFIASHVYDTLGTFNGSVTITDDDGGQRVEPFTIIVTDQPPAAPSNLQATGEQWIDHVEFSWQDNSSDEDGFLIEWSKDGSEWHVIDEVPPDTTQYVDEYPTLGLQYFRVLAYRGVQTILSTVSSALSITPKAPPAAWYDDNAGANERGTLTPYSVEHNDTDGLTFSVLQNDVDYDSSGPLQVVSFAQPSDGVVTYDPSTKSFMYVPSGQYSGTVRFTYVIGDGTSASAPAEVAIDVTNSLPILTSTSFTYSADDVARKIAVAGVMRTNVMVEQLIASDADDDEISLSIVEGPEHGDAVIDSEGRLFYWPSTTFNGADRLVVVAADGVGQGIRTAVTITSDFRREGGILPESPSGLPGDLDVQTAFAALWGAPADTTNQLATSDIQLEVVSDFTQGLATTEIVQQVINGQVWYGVTLDYQSSVQSASDQATYVVRLGNIRTLPKTVVIWDNFDGDAVEADHKSFFEVSNTSPTQLNTTNLYGYGPGTTVTVGAGPSHGVLQHHSGAVFTYTPHVDAETGEIYVGWDTFSVTLTSPQGMTNDHHIHLWVGDYTPPPPLVTEAQSDWVSTPFEGDLAALNSKLSVVESKRNAVFVALEALGIAWQAIDQNEGSADAVLADAGEAIAALDAAQSAYLTYLDGWLELMGNAASYQNTIQAYIDNVWDSGTYASVLNGIQKLPRDLGGLQPNAKYMQRISDALEEFGDAAGFQSNLAGTVFTVAEQTHKNLERAEDALGLFTGGTYSAASILTKAGLKALVKTVARNYIENEIAEAALTPVMSAGLSYLAQLNINVSPTMVRAGMLAVQATGVVKAAKPLVGTVSGKFYGKLRGKRIKFKGTQKSYVEVRKVEPEIAAAYRADFDSNVRRNFLKDLANTPQKEHQLRSAGFSTGDINRMKDGLVPIGFEVHHKQPLDWGGTNSFDNLVLIKETPYHAALTNVQNELSSGLDPGDWIEGEWVMFEGISFYTGK
jgi:regulation of enolase protein 1 (concanavalin A-like superfamily)